jgi:hypothetical protein
MRHRVFITAAVAVFFSLQLMAVTGCGGSGSTGGGGGGGGSPTTPTVTVSPSPSSITTAQSTAVTVTVSSSGNPTPTGTVTLTSGSYSSVAVSLNGSGSALITVPASSLATGSNTLTATYTSTSSSYNNASGLGSVTVTIPVSIGSFTANPTTISSGSNSSLTAVFTGGTGVITPGNIPVTSGNAVSVSPTITTIYMLTVTPTSGTAATQTVTVTVQSSVTVNPSSPGIAVTDQILGMNLAAWYNWPTNATSINAAFNAAGIKAIRWPGGSWSDDYHWGYQTGSSTLVASYMCQTAAPVTGGWGGYSTFAAFVSAIPLAGPFDLALTANYGSNETCTGGGDPKEAAAWASAAANDGITVSHMTVGNEEYGSWEDDLHAVKHDPTTYANAVKGSSGYYDLIKAANTGTLVGVIVDANCTTANGCTNGWDSTVLSSDAGYYDFVEYHYYPQNPGGENDSFLIQQAAPIFTTNIDTIKSELTTAGKAGTPIYVGEIGSVSSNPGKQTWSITQGLYAAQILGEMMNDGVSRGTWWIGFGNCNGNQGNDSSSLYGWQSFGAYNVFSDGSGDTGGSNNSACNYGSPIGTMSPTAIAFQLFSNVAVNGENVLTPTVAGDTTNVRAYAATHSGGTALVLFNLDENASAPVTVTLTGKSTSSDVQVTTYSKAIYDLTQNNAWDPAATTDMGSQSLPLSLTLAPWSMNVVIVK